MVQHNAISPRNLYKQMAVLLSKPEFTTVSAYRVLKLRAKNSICHIHMETKQDTKQDFRHLVRIGNTDLDGNKHTYPALTKIKGVGFMLANALCNIARVEKTKKIGYLTENEIQKLDEILKDLLHYGLPSWMVNRRKSPDDGLDKHLITSDLQFMQDNDIKMMKKMHSYKGVRHIMGQPVRGQRTRSHFRKNKGKVHLGVQRSKTAKAGKV